MNTLKWAARTLHITTNDTATAPRTSETLITTPSNQGRRDFGCCTAYQFYNILRQKKIESWCQWHLHIDGKDNAIKTSKEFHQDFGKNKSSKIKDEIRIIEETLKSMHSDSNWSEIRVFFKQAADQNCPLMFIKAYTQSQPFTENINKSSAANTYHVLKIYCTVLNCPILARTQECTDAVTRICFHSELDGLLIDRERTVYRGCVLGDGKMINNYEEGATILTTTQLSTSTGTKVPEMFADTSGTNQISVFCTYKLYNTRRRTALDLGPHSQYPDEDEILILRFVPFTITFIERRDNERRVNICFEEC